MKKKVEFMCAAILLVACGQRPEGTSDRKGAVEESSLTMKEQPAREVSRKFTCPIELKPGESIGNIRLGSTVDELNAVSEKVTIEQNNRGEVVTKFGVFRVLFSSDEPRNTMAVYLYLEELPPNCLILNGKTIDLGSSIERYKNEKKNLKTSRDATALYELYPRVISEVARAFPGCSQDCSIPEKNPPNAPDIRPGSGCFYCDDGRMKVLAGWDGHPVSVMIGHTPSCPCSKPET